MDALREMNQTISVIIPAFNREGSIGRTINSIQSSASDAYEVIVVDDGSSDETVARAQAALGKAHPGVGRVLQQANAGPGAARNAGAKVARGRYLAFLDSDDFWLPGTLDACFKALDGTDPALVFLQTFDIFEGQEIGQRGGEAPSLRRFDGFLEAVEGLPSTRYGSCNVLVRRDIYQALGGFTTEVRCSEDSDLFLRAAACGSCIVLSDVSLVAHIQGAGDRLTAQFSQVLAGYEFMLRQEEDGVYPDAPGGKRLKDVMLAKCTAHTVLAAFAAGRGAIAYRLYTAGLPRLWRAGNWHWLIRLPFVPLLAFLRPSSYRMRWTASD